MSKSSEDSSKAEIVIEFVSEEFLADIDLLDSDYIDQYLKNIHSSQKFIYD